MNIAEEVSFDNTGHIEPTWSWRRLYLALVIILVATLSFGIGRLTGGGDSEPIRIEYDPLISNIEAPNLKQAQNSNIQAEGSVYASSNGKRYYYANCSGLSRISEKNKVAFASAALAEAAGYTLASNCQP